MRAVFLDVDDTLVDYERAARTALAEAVGFADGWQRWKGLDSHERFARPDLDYAEFRQLRMRDFLKLMGRDGTRSEEIEQARFAGIVRHCALFEDVLPCLAMLRERDLRIGLITNNETEHQRRKIAAVGLDTLVDSVAISQEVGVGKPDARIFSHACAQLGVEPGEAMHVGDNGVADVDGAAHAGLRAVWLDRPGAPERLMPSTRTSYATVTTLAGLGELV